MDQGCYKCQINGPRLAVAYKAFTSLPPNGGQLKTWKEQDPNQGQKRLSTPSERWTPDSEWLTFEHCWVPTFRFQPTLHPPHLLLKSDLTGCENLKDLTSVYSSSPFTLRCRWPRCDSWFTDDHYSGFSDKNRIQTQRGYVIIVQYPCASRTLAKTLSHLFPGKSRHLQENIYTLLIW